ncbi:hypothetical protein AGMMS49982_18930 [Bacteroidia bacterium]|nr:hypothetical protein AGMMS49982_18930 [Bacteroidia bacterium]
MKQCAFTICAKNYIGLAQILENSIKEKSPELGFFVFVADEFEERPAELSDHVIVSRTVLAKDDQLWEEMAFKYDLTEFCTSIKPRCFQYLLKELHYDKAIYLDPDILVFNSLKPVLDLLDTYSIVLTPHISRIQEHYTGEMPEKEILFVGSYNLGFCAVRNSPDTTKFMAWWTDRLTDKCFVNHQEPYFTDQCWINMLPCFFDSNSLHVSRHIGLNYAPWNQFEREGVVKDSEWYVKLRNEPDDTLYDLIFAHFSGYDYKNLINDGIVTQRGRPVKEYDDAAIILNRYKEILASQKENFEKYLNMSYSYNFFDNGASVLPFHRRLYNGLLQEGKKYTDLFGTQEENSFYTQLKKKNLLSSFNLKAYIRGNKKDINKNKSRANKVFVLLYKILGYKKFQMLIEFFINYSKQENFTFLLGKRGKQENIL